MKVVLLLLCFIVVKSQMFGKIINFIYLLTDIYLFSKKIHVQVIHVDQKKCALL